MNVLNVSKIAQKVRAISSTVRYVERSRLFYTQAFSCKLVSDTILPGDEYSQLQNIKPAKVRIVTLELGEELIELIEYLDIEGQAIPEDSQSNDLWFQHLAIVVSDIDRAYERLKSFEIEPISRGLQTLSSGIRAFKFKDPDHHDLEIIWFPPQQSQDKWNRNTKELFLGIDHSAITVADTQQSLEFYQDLLGMKVEQSNINSGKIQALLDGLPEAKVRVTAMQPQQSSLGIEFLDYIVPGTGRLFPDDYQSYDLATMQIQLLVDDIKAAVKILGQNGVEIISPNIVQFPDSHPYRQACTVKDPNGHTVVLISI